MPPYSSLLSWRILCTEEPGGLQSTGSQSQATERLSSRHDKVSATECFQLRHALSCTSGHNKPEIQAGLTPFEAQGGICPCLSLSLWWPQAPLVCR